VTGGFGMQDCPPREWRATTLRGDVRPGLSRAPKTLPPKWLYDANGSALFDQITELPEYYPTRTERATRGLAADEIAAAGQAHTLAGDYRDFGGRRGVMHVLEDTQ
jgi:uncharacterized SAM-dependent methyltransferase